MGRHRIKHVLWASGLCLALSAQAQGATQNIDQDDDDAGALSLADQITAPVATPRSWRNFVEAAAGNSDPRSGAGQSVQRLSFDTRYDGSIASGWRGVFSDRLDVNAPAQTPGNNGINTVKEAYVSWQQSDAQIIDWGRINERNGVGLGYNPTDFFKSGALRSVVSVDPQSLKENRQGSVMMRAQQIWGDGSLTALYSPKLGTQADTGAYSLNVGATNALNRGMLIYSPKWSELINPQFLMFKQDQTEVQWGLNLSALLGESAVVNVEWSGGQNRSQLSQAMAQQGLPYADDQVFRQRMSSGVTYTTENKMSFSAELEFNGQGLNQNDWNTLRTTKLPLYGVYENWVQTQQELPTQRAAFGYFNWQDALISRLDLTVMQRYDMVDNSRMIWMEARYHLLDHAEFALQWQRNQGSALSDFGVLPLSQSVLAVVRGYF